MRFDKTTRQLHKNESSKKSRNSSNNSENLAVENDNCGFARTGLEFRNEVFGDDSGLSGGSLDQECNQASKVNDFSMKEKMKSTLAFAPQCAKLQNNFEAKCICVNLSADETGRSSCNLLNTGKTNNLFLEKVTNAFTIANYDVMPSSSPMTRGERSYYSEEEFYHKVVNDTSNGKLGKYQYRKKVSWGGSKNYMSSQWFHGTL